ncbi:uncharacterized protein LOC101235498 [Hydra vulgaris]|uniref:uncharacterized protein LOC101235498 n=1 Tax=Hydra vulgaris TaxID=6087 RepID=UPI001F5ECB2B|nr:uncharacterized protein LOC101235498 [Hydra vulgaris]
MAQLTPLGWTCIGGTGRSLQTHFTKITSSTKKIEDANNTIKKLWEIESDEKMQFRNTMSSPEDSTTFIIVTNSLKTENGRYELKLPWKVVNRGQLQELWIDGIEWDDALPDRIANNVDQWFQELNDLPKLNISRCLQTPSTVTNKSLHVFTDASCKAFGAVAYQQCLYDIGEVTCVIIMSKARVSPLQSISIPRLELLGAVLGLQLAEKIVKALKLETKDVTIWSNLLTRGTTVKELESNNVWWHGPSFLNYLEEKWPQNHIEVTQEALIEVKKNPVLMNFALSTEVTKQWLDINKFSSWKRLIRIKGWIHRFIRNCRLETGFRKKGDIAADEYHESENEIIANAQKESFEEEYSNIEKEKPILISSKIISLNPQINEDGLLRSCSRLQNAHYLSYDVKHSSIFPRGHKITKLIVKHYHDEANHVMGTNQLLTKLLERYWVIRGRVEIRDAEAKYNKCKLRKCKPAQQLMALLPPMRFKEPLREFARIGINFAGPFLTMQGRGKIRQKRYLCLFTCLLSRAVHLDIAYNLDTNSFLNAFYRMVNRRRLPLEV